jgi:hypothetical protein
MIKKRAMAAGRQFGKTNLTTTMSDAKWDATRRLDIGYAENQPKWPYWVQPQYYSATEWHNMNKWMRATFGDTDWLKEDARWVGSNRVYWFYEESDRTLFLLRWS